MALYFLDNSKKSFNKFVREAIEGISADELQSKDLMMLYKISKDMAHASGYSFNATDDFVRVTSHRVVHATFFVIYHFLLNAINTLEDHNIKADLSIIEYALKLHMQIQIDAIGEIYKKHASESD